MKRLLFAVCIFTTLTFLALPMGEIGQSAPDGKSVTHSMKAFEPDNGQIAAQARKDGTTKAEISVYCENWTGDIEVTVTNPCTYVRIGSSYFKKCY